MPELEVALQLLGGRLVSPTKTHLNSSAPTQWKVWILASLGVEVGRKLGGEIVRHVLNVTLRWSLSGRTSWGIKRRFPRCFRTAGPTLVGSKLHPEEFEI